MWEDPADDARAIQWTRDNYERLAAVKAGYDPDDVFHLHHPIRPAAA